MPHFACQEWKSPSGLVAEYAVNDHTFGNPYLNFSFKPFNPLEAETLTVVNFTSPRDGFFRLSCAASVSPDTNPETGYEDCYLNLVLSYKNPSGTTVTTNLIHTLWSEAINLSTNTGVADYFGSTVFYAKAGSPITATFSNALTAADWNFGQQDGFMNCNVTLECDR